MFCVCVLLYGDYPGLALQCLNSIIKSATQDRWRYVSDVRIGCNQTSPATNELVQALAKTIEVPCYVVCDVNNVNRGKYPMMRKMFKAATINASHIMWFDDDSYLRGNNLDWWADVNRVSSSAVLLGSKYRPKSGFTAEQVTGIRAQSWYTGKPITDGPNYKVTFVTGGWWVMQVSAMQKFDYPFVQLHHNGGDTVLGELCRQQSWRIYRFNNDVMINAGTTGKESRADRRGINSKVLWRKELVPELHDFRVTVATYLPGHLNAIRRTMD